MTPTQHQSSTRVLGAPKGHNVSDPNDPAYCSGLAITDCVIDGELCMQSVWVPSEEEIVAILNGSKILLTVVGSFHPMVRIGVTVKP